MDCELSLVGPRPPERFMSFDVLAGAQWATFTFMDVTETWYSSRDIFGPLSGWLSLLQGWEQDFCPRQKEQLREMPYRSTRIRAIIPVGFREFYFIPGRGMRTIEYHFTPDFSYVSMLDSKSKVGPAADLEISTRLSTAPCLLCDIEIERSCHSKAVRNC